MPKQQSGCRQPNEQTSLWNRSLLQCQHRVALETRINLEILGNFTNKPLEWQLPDQELSTLLVLNGFHEERQY
ncbi:hypothetical protein ACFX13_035971 [Malus domestica]